MQGPFPQVLDFLRSLESLQVFVIISDMNVQAQAASGEGDATLPEVTLSLTLTAYGRQQAADVPKEKKS